QQFAEEHGLNRKDSPAGEGPKFSHAWVVGGNRTTTKSSVLCSDPQTPVRNPSLFYEYHFSGKTFNARGIGVPGSPILLIGWTPHVAWGGTALGADQADLFMLKTDEEHPNQYYFDGQWRDMTVWKETIHVKGGEPVEMTLRETHLGPVVTSIANGLKPGEEAAQKRIPICDEGCATIQGAVAMMRARNAEEFSRAIHGWRFPSLNILYGDRRGAIGYCALAAVPIRSKYALEGGGAAHEGHDSKYDWQGILPFDLLPQVLNPQDGLLFSGNHRPIQSFYPISIGVSTGAMGDSDRSWRLRQRLENKDLFTPEEALDVHYDTVNAVRKGIVAAGYHLRDALKAELSEDARKTLKHLEGWFEKGARSDNSILGTELAIRLPLMFRIVTSDLAGVYGGGFSGLCRFLKEMERRVEEDPQAPCSEMERAYIDQTLAQAWRDAEKQYGRDPQSWNQRAQEQRLQRKLGYMDSLDGFGSLDPSQDLTYPGLACIDGGTIFSQAAQSYSQWIPMHDVDGARSLLPIGNSEHPGSPYRLCTYEAWAKGELHPAPISREKVEKIAVEREVLGS
ncbi:MAG: penicillin acylase family protein, partial [Candidatus Hinthialibacter sp.]